MYAAACAAQRLGGHILSGEWTESDVRLALIDAAPPPRNPLEHIVLEGLIAQASAASRKWLTRQSFGQSYPIASRGAALL